MDKYLLVNLNMQEIEWHEVIMQMTNFKNYFIVQLSNNPAEISVVLKNYKQRINPNVFDDCVSPLY